MANDVNRLIDMLYERIEDAKSPALKPNMSMVDRDELLDLLDELRAQLPRDSAVSSTRISGLFRSMFTLPTMVLSPVSSIKSMRSSVASLCMVANIQALVVALCFMFSANMVYAFPAYSISLYLASSGNVRVFSHSNSSRSIPRPLNEYCGAWR